MSVSESGLEADGRYQFASGSRAARNRSQIDAHSNIILYILQPIKLFVLEKVGIFVVLYSVKIVSI